MLLIMLVLCAGCWHLLEPISCDCLLSPNRHLSLVVSSLIEVGSDEIKISVDADQDGILDQVEDQLAQRFAPIVFHGQCESNYPVSVDWLLARNSLYVTDGNKSDREIIKNPVSQLALLNQAFDSGEKALSSTDTRSQCKQSSFYLANVARHEQSGAHNDPRQWITYVHSYPNNLGGVSIQYWRCYAYNQASFLGADFSHGGDWEHVTVHLGAAFEPQFVAFPGHVGIEYHTSEVQWEGEHPKIWSEEGGHASLPSPKEMKSSRFTRQETWNGGQVTWWDGSAVGSGGGLLNVGEKSHPRNDQVFIQYSGLWGSPGKLFITSGYWGPAFNETAATCEDGSSADIRSPFCAPRPANCGRMFLKAWCDGMDETRMAVNVECYAVRASH